MMRMREILCLLCLLCVCVCCVKTDIVVTETVYKICSISHIYIILFLLYFYTILQYHIEANLHN
jgi:hypothetical protein